VVTLTDGGACKLPDKVIRRRMGRRQGLTIVHFISLN
jgi:hypothetical protein